jgi:hypothetical protein
LLNKIVESYRKAPHFEQVYPLIEKCFYSEETNLFSFILNSIVQIKQYLTISTKISVSSIININHDLKSVEKVFAICKKLDASTYINPIGGIELYNKEQFELNYIKLQFQKSNPIKYIQYKNEFIPWLSIIDVLMFNKKDDVINYLNNYKLL